MTLLDRRVTHGGGVSRIGGPGFELGERHPKKGKSRLTHIITIACADVQVWKLPADVVAVSLYLASPRNNQLYKPHLKGARVMMLHAEDLAAGDGKPTDDDLPLQGLVATTLDMPMSESRVSNALVNAPGFAAHDAIWLDDMRQEGGFLFQFDNKLVANIDLGDAGIMYVTDDTAFWQCD